MLTAPTYLSFHLQQMILLSRSKKDVGQPLDATLPNANVSPTFLVSPVTRRYFDVSTFIAALSSFAHTFSTLQDAVGINHLTHGGGVSSAVGAMANDGTQFLKIGIDAGGRLKFEGVTEFWNHFVIMLSPYAVQLFQMQDLIQTPTVQFIGVTTVGGVQTPTGLSQGGNVTAGTNLLRGTLIARGSILKYLDHRLFITVETPSHQFGPEGN